MIVAVCAIATSLIMTWPLASQMTEVMPGMGAIRDPYLHSWQVAWQAHALETDGTDYFQANTQWPHENTLAFIDTATGYTVAGFLGEGLDAAVTRYNVLYLFAYSLAFVGAYLLARQLGCGVVGSAVAAAAFAFAPWRAAQNGHIIVLSSGGIPLALFFLLRGYAQRTPMLVVVGGVVAAWQMSVGFTLGLQFTYLLGLLSAIFLVRVWRRTERNLSPRFIAAVIGAAAIFLAVATFLAIPYLRVANEHPEAANRLSEVELYSPPPSGFLVAPEYNFLWGDSADELRRRLSWPEEQTLFPGIAIAGLAVLGVFSPALPKKARVFVVVGVVTTVIVSMGLAWGPSRAIYSFLYDLAPGWRGVRTPGRLNTSTSLALAVLAGAGAQFSIGRLAATAHPRRRRAVAMVVAFAVIAAVLVEGRGSIWAARPHDRPAGLEAAEPPILHLPFDEISDRIYTFWSIDGFPKIVNGVGAIVPKELETLRTEMVGFPDADTVATLREMGVETVIWHEDLAASTPWQGTPNKPIEGLGITRTDVGDVILFDLDPTQQIDL